MYFQLESKVHVRVHQENINLYTIFKSGFVWRWRWAFNPRDHFVKSLNE